MAENKTSFVLYPDQKGLFEKLPDEIAGKLIKHIFRYVNDENPEIDKKDLLLSVAFEPIKMQLKRDLAKWQGRAERSRENGKLGGRPKKHNKTQKTQRVISKPRKPDNVNVNVNVKNKEIIKEKDHWLLEWIEKNTPRVQKLDEPLTAEEANRLTEKVPLDVLKDILQSMENYKPLLKKSVSANQTIQNWAKRRDGATPKKIIEI